MATRYGHQRAALLVDRYGWKWADPLPEGIMGDRRVIDPETGEEMDPHSAYDVQMQRNIDIMQEGGQG